LRLIIADDHPLFLAAVQAQIERSRPDADIVICASLDEALQAASATPPAAFMLDFSMPGMDGVAGIQRVRATYPRVPIVIMSGTANTQQVTESVRAGANGFLPKSLGPEIFIQALNVVLAGGTYLPADIIAGAVAERSAPPAKLEPAGETGLTPREFQVLQAIVNGKSNKEIARDLELQEVTVKLHARRVYQKLSARNRAEVTAIAIERRIVQRSAD
jgi:DNA-binding NarL/FixJ family response regulator